MQELAEVAPVVVEYLPAIQLVHTVKAAAPEYVPAVQLVQTVEPVAAGS